MARLCIVHIRTLLIKANFESKIPGQSGKLGRTPGPRPKNGTVPAKTGRVAILHLCNQFNHVCTANFNATL